MHRTVEEATIKRLCHKIKAEFNTYLQPFLVAYNYTKRLKHLRGLTPYEFVCAGWRKKPTTFNSDPTYSTLYHILILAY